MPFSPSILTSYGQLEYALSRIHAVLGRFPTESAWGTLTPIARFDHLLSAAAKQGFSEWLVGIRAGATVHEVEGALRQRYRNEMLRVGRWAPASYRPLLDWFALLPYLDFVGYLHRGERPREWMQDDTLLSDWLSSAEGIDDLGILQKGLNEERGRHRVAKNWMQELYSRLPEDLEFLEGDRRFKSVLQAMVEGHPIHDFGVPLEQRIERRLWLEAHRSNMTPRLIPAYAMLVYWLLMRLRSELVTRVAALQAG